MRYVVRWLTLIDGIIYNYFLNLGLQDKDLALALYLLIGFIGHAIYPQENYEIANKGGNIEEGNSAWQG